MYDFSKVQHISDGNLNSSGEEALEFRNPSARSCTIWRGFGQLTAAQTSSAAGQSC